MKTSSCKAKGRSLQKLICSAILKIFPQLEPDDVQSRSMGASGTDVMLSPAARKLIPVAIEAKNVEKINLWGSWDQCLANAKGLHPVLIIKKNRTEPLAVITLDHFLSLYQRSNNVQRNNSTTDPKRE